MTGIAGNYFIDPRTGEEVMMNSARCLRCGTILAVAADAGRKVAMITAKNKLLDMLFHRLEGIVFSSVRAGEARHDTHGIGDVEKLVGRRTPVSYLEFLLAGAFGEGNRVICSITDPYVVHHGALGFEVMVYRRDASQTELIANWMYQLDGITEVTTDQRRRRSWNFPPTASGT